MLIANHQVFVLSIIVLFKIIGVKMDGENISINEEHKAFSVFVLPIELNAIKGASKTCRFEMSWELN